MKLILATATVLLALSIPHKAQAADLTVAQGICVEATMAAAYNDPKGYCSTVKSEPEANCIAAGLKASWNDPRFYCKNVRSDGTVKCIEAAIAAKYNSPVAYCTGT